MHEELATGVQHGWHNSVLVCEQWTRDQQTLIVADLVALFFKSWSVLWCICSCPCDECNISHMITCGLISPEVNEQQHQYHHHHHQHHVAEAAECQEAVDDDGADITNSEVTPQMSPSHIPRPLSCHYDALQYYANIKPPSIPSSLSSSGSESPIILDRCRFFGENFEYVFRAHFLYSCFDQVLVPDLVSSQPSLQLFCGF